MTKCAEDLKKCIDCGGECCKSVAVKLDTPEDADDFEDFKWYLFRDGWTVFLDDDGDWHVDIPGRCRHLGVNNNCEAYNERPPVCRDFGVCDCDEGEPGKIVFEKPDDVDKYVCKLKKQGKLKPGTLVKW